MRRKTRNFMLGKVGIGSNHPVTIQSMCNTATSDAAKTLAQINKVAQAGCDIIRVSADKDEDIRALYEINEASPTPVVADIQFASEMAVKAIEAKCSAVRVNPGIVRDIENLRPLAAKAIETDTPIRVGANAGSLPRHEIESRLASGMPVPGSLRLRSRSVVSGACTPRFSLFSMGSQGSQAVVCSSVATLSFLPVARSCP